jgi:hypothetical protein
VEIYDARQRGEPAAQAAARVGRDRARAVAEAYRELSEAGRLTDAVNAHREWRARQEGAQLDAARLDLDREQAETRTEAVNWFRARTPTTSSVIATRQQKDPCIPRPFGVLPAERAEILTPWRPGAARSAVSHSEQHRKHVQRPGDRRGTAPEPIAKRYSARKAPGRPKSAALEVDLGEETSAPVEAPPAWRAPSTSTSWTPPPR